MAELPATSPLAFRCDGDGRTGAGHVARSIQIARAFRAGGTPVVFVGSYSGVAATLLSAAGMDARPAGSGPAGLPEGVAGAIVDSYEIPDDELRATGDVALAALSDFGATPAGIVTLDYHLDAEPAEGVIAGPDHAPVDPSFMAARRDRGFEHALVSAGGGDAGDELRSRAVVALEGAGLEVEVAGATAPTPGLGEAARRADVAITAAGVTAYELACAGVPFAVTAIASNQERVARGLARRGIALGGHELEPMVSALADETTRAELAAAGPRVIDGYGAFRARDALRAAFAGRPAPPVQRYRPALPADSGCQLAWRNDPAAREASWSTAPIGEDEHRRWYDSVLADERRLLLVVEDGSGPLGSVRFDLEDSEAEVSLVVDPQRRGRGAGSRAARQAGELVLAAHPTIERIRAQVRPESAASLAAFERAGYAPAPGGEEGRVVLALDRVALASPGI